MKTIAYLYRQVLATLFGAVMLSTAIAGPPQYDTMYVFGDSLSDTGNDFAASSAQHMVPAIPPSVTPHATYWQGRFSNGPVAVEYLWKLVNGKNSAELTPSLLVADLDKKTGVSFAFGGSGSGLQNQLPNMSLMVPGLVGQVGLYTTALRGKKSKPNALYVVWSGSNDYLQNITLEPYEVVGNVTKSIRALYDTGARQFLVPNLPDMGVIPFVKAQGASAQFTLLAKTHNAYLASSLNALRSLPGIKFFTVDVFTLGETLINSGLVIADVPALAFLSPDTRAVDCLVTNPYLCVDVVQTGFLPPYLYWDVMHPTTQVHGVIGTAMYGALLKK